MKKLFTIVTVALLSVTVAKAGDFGIIGGFTSSNTSVNTKDLMSNVGNVSLFHAGVAFRQDIGPFFSIQPQLAYQMKGASVQEMMDTGDVKTAFSTLNTKAGFIELSVGLQVGVDLLAFRPFLMLEPFVGYQVTGNESYSDIAAALSDDYKATMNSYLSNAKNKLEGGFGVGGGVHFLGHFQVSVQWFMNFGKLYDDGKIDSDAIKSVVLSSYKDIKNYQGLKVTLGFFF